MIIEKDISKLAVGTYVIGIAKQKGRFKIKKPGWVRDKKSIQYLIDQGVLKVKIDSSKKLAADTADVLDVTREDDLITAPKANEKFKPSNKKTNNIGERLVKAKKIFDEAKQIQSKVLSDIQQGRPIDTGPIKSLTNQSIDIIFDNPDALACIINIRCKDEYLLEHSISVSILISIFARFLKMDKSIVHELAIGAFLHDVGKIKIPDEILNKPGKLTEKEFELMKTHVVHSKKIVDETNELSEISRSIVASHHEKLNGHGYPLGIGQDKLSIYDRMITICDIFDALSAHRVYKPGIAQIKAFLILRELAEAGQLDKRLVDQFIKCLGVYPVGSLVKLTSNRLAIVDSRNHDLPTKPKVKVFYSLQQNVFTPTKEIDLSLSNTEEIMQGVRADDFDLDMNKITEFLLMQG